jgi:hypothetical protein
MPSLRGLVETIVETALAIIYTTTAGLTQDNTNG